MSKARILIVEDEVIIALQLEEKLKSMGYEVTSTSITPMMRFKKQKPTNQILS